MHDIPAQPPADLKVLSETPLVAGSPLDTLGDSQLTRTRRFFVRNHFAIPKLDASSWRLSVAGEVQRPLQLSYEELVQLPRQELTVLLECAGNSRASAQPPVEGLLWDHTGVSTACWVGVPLRTVLEQAGLPDTAREVLFEGADRGKERGAPGEFHYAMSLPLEGALEPDILLAYEMNGERLSPDHGFPLRLVKPGWYGMASVKWLTSIRVLDHPFEGFHQSRYYVYIQEGASVNESPRQRVTSMKVKSLITWPARGQILPTGENQVRGVAWSGQGPVSLVEVSTDNGSTWHPADLGPSESPYAWRRWAYTWEAQPGYYLLRARATDIEGNVQPMQARWNFRGFANNSIHAVPVQVRASL